MYSVTGQTFIVPESVPSLQ